MRHNAALARRLGAAILVLLFASLATGCTGGLFKNLLEGKNGSAFAGTLKISPASASMVAGKSLQLTVSGGDGNYVFLVIGSGSFDAASMTYTAPATAGANRVQVSDGTGATAVAVISVKLAPAPDYRVALSPAPTFPGPGAGGSAFAGSFRIENISTEAGAAPIGWKVYISKDTTLDPLDLLAASGTIGALGAASSSTAIAFSGTWPAASASYYIIIVVTAADDANPANNQTISPAITVTGSASPAYSITSVSPLAATLVQSASAIANQTLIITDIGTGQGSYPISWAVYLLPKTTIGAQDTALVSGTTPALASAASVSLPFPGTNNYPTIPGTYYFVAQVSAFDDTAGMGAKVLASSPIIVSGPLYNVAVGAPTGTNTTGSAVSGTITISNGGNGNGASPISWAVYASISNTLSAGDSLLASGTTPALAFTASISLPYTGVWPSVAGSYYIVATAQAADDATVGMAASGSAVAVAGPSYIVMTPVPAPTGNTTGGAVSGSFTVNNTGTGTGSSPVSWSVYASLNSTAAITTGDSLIEFGTTPALGPGASSSPSPTYAGTWPTVAGAYYIKVQVQSTDDPQGGVFVSSSTTAVAGPTYSVTAVPPPTGTTAGGAVSGTFTIKNTGIGDGVSPVSWSEYASTTTTIGANSVLIESGSIAGLAAGASSSPSYSGTWPSVAGSYYIVVRVQAADAVTIGTLASLSPVTVAGPTYTVTAVPAPTGTTAGVGVSGTFTIKNTGIGNGVRSVSWSMYASSNPTIGAGAILIASGSIPAGLAAGASSTPNYSGTWPAAAGTYYLIASAQAVDAATIGTLASSPITVTP